MILLADSKGHHKTARMRRLIRAIAAHICPKTRFRMARPFRSITKTCLFKYTENFTIKTENFQIKSSDIFHISAQNIDCRYSLEPRRGGSNDYPQSMFLSRNKKNNIYPCKPQFCYKKWGLRGSNLYRHVFVMFVYISILNVKYIKTT